MLNDFSQWLNIRKKEKKIQETSVDLVSVILSFSG